MKLLCPVMMLAVLPIVVDAQSKPATPPIPDMSLTARFSSQYTYVKGNLIKMAEKMPAEHYPFQPAPEVKTFAANMAHIIQSNTAQCSSVLGRTSPYAGQNLEKTLTAKADVVKALNDSFALCDEMMTKATNEQYSSGTYEITLTRDGQKVPVKVPFVSSVSSLISHSNEMYGYMSVYMRLKGIVPPSSEPAK